MCDAVAENGWRAFRASQEQSEVLSEIMRGLSAVDPADRDEAFRSPKSIQRKSYGLVTSHSTYSGKPTKGGAPTRQVVAEFELNSEKIRREAASLRAALWSAAGEILTQGFVVALLNRHPLIL